MPTRGHSKGWESRWDEAAQQSSPGGSAVPRGQCPETFLVVTAWRQVLLAFCRQRPGCCSTPYSAQDSPRTKDCLAPNVDRATVEKP